MVYGLLTKLIVSGKLKFEEGRIVFTDHFMTLISELTLKEMTLDAMKKGKKAINQLYFYGWHYGFTFTNSYMKTFSLRPFEETFKLIMDVASLIGFGDYQTLEFRQRKFSRFKNIQNPFGLLFYPSNEKVCHYIRGMNAGGGAALHDVLMNGIELNCIANNKQYCLFMNVNNRILLENYSDVAKEQLDLKWLEGKQIELIKSYGFDPSKFLNYE